MKHLALSCVLSLTTVFSVQAQQMPVYLDDTKPIDVHPSLIPSFCGPGFYGLKVHEAALARGVKLTGATVHLVNEECDGGPILLQKAVAVQPGDTPETLQKRVMVEAEWQLLPKALAMVCSDEV